MNFQLAPYLAESVPGMGLFGALVGGTNAIARNAFLLETNQLSPGDALIETGKETLKSGLVTGLSTAATIAVGGGLTLSIGVAVAVSIVSKYIYDRGADAALDKIRKSPAVHPVKA